MDLNYKIFLLEDNGNYAELDSEDIQMQTTFAISDVSDITSKKDTISINITLKGTKNNNRALGNLYNQSRYVTSTSEMLFTNFSINSKINCMVLENSIQILSGYLQVSKVYQVDGALNYECIITGNIVNFFTSLASRMTDDLDFSRLQHTYSIDNIWLSWGDPVNSAIYYNGSQVDFEMGKGYVYPFINFGQNSPSDSTKLNQIDYNNFRPAVYVNEYLNSIFGGTALSNYSYEIRGTDEFLDNWNRLIIPPDGDYFFVKPDGSSTMFFATDTTGDSINLNDPFATTVDKLYMPLTYQGTQTINYNCLTINHITGANAQGGHESSMTVDYLYMNKNVVGDLTITVPYFSLDNNTSKDINCYIRLFSRAKLGTGDGNYKNLDSFGQDEDILIGTAIANGATLTVTNKTLLVSQKQFDAGKEYFVAITMETTDGSHLALDMNMNWTSASISIAGNTKYSVVLGDTIVPNPVTGIKQQDFVKSLTLLFNLYTYSELHNPKHIIFETYDSFYSRCVPRLIGTNSTDYTKKIDYSQNFTIEPATQIADAYNFTYKSDGDYYNNLYNKSYNEIYGSYGFTNSYSGDNDVKVELVFSPTPVVSFATTNRVEPEIYSQDDSGVRTPFKSNARILYYNGIKKCTPWAMGTWDSSFSTFTKAVPIPLAGTFSWVGYPMTSTFKYQDGVWTGSGGILAQATAPTASIPTNDLNFGLAQEYYFTVGTEIYGAVNAYQDFYSNQLGEMTNLNNYYVECSAWLNENDISNLDLKTPIFIQNEFGNAYYKILEVEYNNRFETSTLKLQKINF